MNDSKLKIDKNVNIKNKYNTFHKYLFNNIKDYVLLYKLNVI